MKNNVFDTPKGRITNKVRTICEVHREIYDECFLALHESNSSAMMRLTVLLNEAFHMGIRMDRNLVEYHLGAEGGDVLNENLQESVEKRKQRIEISERLL